MSTGARAKIEATPDRGPSEFLLRACHDLRACLRAIRPHAELLLKNGGAASHESAGKHLGFILDGTDKLNLLVEGLAGYAVALQIDQAMFQATSTEVVLRGVLRRIEKELRGNSARVSYDKLPRVSGDPDRLGQVFDILIRTCLLHRGKADPHIHIGTRPHAEGWLFSIRGNDGAGVDAAYLERIFQPFERLDGRGDPGLGLATCRVIVERHGGRIWAESSGSGCTFCFILPRAEA